MELFKFHLENWLTVCSENHCAPNSVSGQVQPSHSPLKSLLYLHLLLKTPSKPPPNKLGFSTTKNNSYFFEEKDHITSFQAKPENNEKPGSFSLEFIDWTLWALSVVVLFKIYSFWVLSWFLYCLPTPKNIYLILYCKGRLGRLIKSIPPLWCVTKNQVQRPPTYTELLKPSFSVLEYL